MSTRNRTAELLEESLGREESSDNSNYISGQLDRLEENISSLRYLHKQRLASVGSANLLSLQTKLDALDSHSRSIISSCLHILNKQRLGPGPLGKRLEILTLTLSRVLSSASQDYKKRTERELRIALPEASPSQIRNLVEDYEPGMAFRNTLSGNRRVLRDVLRRKDEMQKLEESVEDLAELFTQIHELLKVISSS